MKTFFLKIGGDIANYWQLYLVTLFVASLILLYLDVFGVINLPSILDSLVK